MEDDLDLHIKGIEIQVKNWMAELTRFLSTIRFMGKPGPIEEAIIDLHSRNQVQEKLTASKLCLAT